MRVLERLQGLLLGLASFRRLEGHPDHQLSRLDHRVIAVLQHRDPLHPAGEALLHLTRRVCRSSWLDRRLVHDRLLIVTSATECNTMFLNQPAASGLDVLCAARLDQTGGVGPDSVISGGQSPPRHLDYADRAGHPRTGQSRFRHDGNHLSAHPRAVSKEAARSASGHPGYEI